MGVPWPRRGEGRGKRGPSRPRWRGWNWREECRRSRCRHRWLSHPWTSSPFSQTLKWERESEKQDSRRKKQITHSRWWVWLYFTFRSSKASKFSERIRFAIMVVWVLHGCGPVAHNIKGRMGDACNDYWLVSWENYWVV